MKSLGGVGLSPWSTYYSYPIASLSYLFYYYHLLILISITRELPGYLSHHVLGTDSKFYLPQFTAVVLENCKLPVDDDHL